MKGYMKLEFSVSDEYGLWGSVRAHSEDEARTFLAENEVGGYPNLSESFTLTLMASKDGLSEVELAFARLEETERRLAHVRAIKRDGK